jgi:hypothetical protein
MMEAAATFLDLYDAWNVVRTGTTEVPSDLAQRDLRALAAWFKDHPDVDDEAFRYVRTAVQA